MRRAAAVVLALSALAGCSKSNSGDQHLKVSAAASLSRALIAYQPNVQYSFAGSDQLAAQIRAGARPDVFASANTKLPQALYAAGLVERPEVFAGNRLTVVVPAGSRKVRSFADLGRPGVAIAVGSPTVPIGAYTRELLGRVPAGERTRILANVRTNEPDVSGVVGKVSLRAVDAGFVYVTDATAAQGLLKVIALPPALRRVVPYAAAVVKGAKRRAQARAFVAGLLGPKGAAALRRAGFEPPPGG